MKKLTALVAILLCMAVGIVHAEERKTLTPDEQTAFLAKRTSINMMGSFDSYCSMLYALRDVAIHTDSQEVNQTRLRSPFPKFYKPTWRELFDTVARQTKSSWAYDPKLDFWVFTEPPSPLPFNIDLADGWASDYRGLYVLYKPPSAPVGMDIYMMGRYSDSEMEQELFTRVRNEIAMMFSRSFSEDVTTQDMSEVQVGRYDALHFKVFVPKTGFIWRQWVIVESGRAIAIVSAIKPEQEEVILPDVQDMLKTFSLSKGEETKGDGEESENEKGAGGRHRH